MIAENHPLLTHLPPGFKAPWSGFHSASTAILSSLCSPKPWILSFTQAPSSFLSSQGCLIRMYSLNCYSFVSSPNDPHALTSFISTSAPTGLANSLLNILPWCLSSLPALNTTTFQKPPIQSQPETRHPFLYLLHPTFKNPIF